MRSSAVTIWLKLAPAAREFLWPRFQFRVLA